MLSKLKTKSDKQTFSLYINLALTIAYIIKYTLYIAYIKQHLNSKNVILKVATLIIDNKVLANCRKKKFNFFNKLLFKLFCDFLHIYLSIDQHLIENHKSNFYAYTYL